MKKRIISILIAIICIFNIFSIPVRADSKKKIIKPVVIYMKAAKSYNPDKMKTCFIKNQLMHMQSIIEICLKKTIRNTYHMKL